MVDADELKVRVVSPGVSFDDASTRKKPTTTKPVMMDDTSIVEILSHEMEASEETEKVAGQVGVDVSRNDVLSTPKLHSIR